MEPYQDAGTVTKANVKSTGGRVRYVRVTNANAAVRYFLVHNKATAPVATDVPAFWVLLPAGTAAVPSVTAIARTEFDAGFITSTGLGWSISTTPTAFTDSATAADHTTTIFYN